MQSSAHDALPGLPYEGEHVSIRQVPGERVVVLERNEVPFPEAEDALDACFVPFVRVLRELPRRELHLVIDTRRSPGRNDVAFENVQRKYHGDIFTGFRSASVVLASVVGHMQVSRYEREAGSDYARFESLDEALEALRDR